ncbi:hypothetical protein EDB84DRAFT_1670683 [Lactarius hengduanensis]|nr:hypothetical protein EDB84DRAFT_1670683 [Lactarius hengduanensis]
MSNTTGKSSQQTRKLFIQIPGAPCSGKNMTANPLSRLINGVVIDHDILLEKGIISFDKAAERHCRQHLQLRTDTEPGNCARSTVKADNVGMLDERLRKRVPLRSQRARVDCPPRDAGGAGGSEDSHALFKKWIEDPCRPVDLVTVFKFLLISTIFYDSTSNTTSIQISTSTRFSSRAWYINKI